MSNFSGSHQYGYALLLVSFSKLSSVICHHITEGRFFRYIERAVLFSLACYQGRKKLIRRRFC